MWEAFCQRLRECGRSGYLFMVVILLIAAGALFGQTGIAVLLALLGAYLIWFCVEVRRQQDRFEHLGQQPPLAAVDLRVARVKLANSKTQRLQAEQSQRLKTQRMNGVRVPAAQPSASARVALRLRAR